MTRPQQKEMTCLMKKYIKAAAVAMALLLAVTGLAGCAKKKASANVVITSSYVFIDDYEAYGKTVSEKLPQYNTDDAEIKYISYSGSGGGGMGGTKIDAMLATSDIDVFICDRKTAIRYSENGAMYEDLSALFSEEELEAIKYSLITLPILDENDTFTDEETAPVAFDISGHSVLKDIVMQEDIYVLIPSNAVDKEAAKEIIKVIAAD